jgi:hypothetical protein
MKHLFKLLILVTALSSCELIEDTDNGSLSQEEMAEGLKAALVVGTDTSTEVLSALNGYYTDAAVKILLPEAIQASVESFKTKSINIGFATVTGADLYDGYQNSLLNINIPGLKAKEDDILLGINRAAEDAASEAAPIFVDAITSISILDAGEILFSSNNRAATDYLEAGTSTTLYGNYEPKIDVALNKIQIGGSPLVSEYEDFVNQYNDILNTNVGIGTIGSLMNLQVVTVTDLSAHATQKGLDGLFLKISEEEADIRQDPLARVSAILEKVFGLLD